MLGALALALLISWSIDSAYAIIRACRTDPIIWFSNGAKLQVAASIAASSDEVESITYTLHVARGLSVDKIVYTGGALKDKERVVVVFDRKSGYQIDTTVALASGSARMTVDAALRSKKKTISGTTSGTLSLLFP
jgi:hypothetical protein